VGVFPGDVRAIPQGETEGASGTAGRVLRNHRLQPQVRDSTAKWARPEKERVRRPREHKPQYGKQVISVLAAVWEAAGYPWSVRLKALLPSWMPWVRKRYRLSAKLEQHCWP